MAKRPDEKSNSPFSAEEKAAMAEVANERKAARTGKVDGESAVRAKIAEMPEADRVVAEGLHALLRSTVPDLVPKTWYGMPAYARDGKVVCFFQSAHQFKSRYATLGFTDQAALDDGPMWPTSFALTAWTPALEADVRALLERAVR